MRGVVYDGNDYQVVDDLSVRDPGPGEVAVRIEAAGVCHSDVSVITGTIPFPTPVVLGHEGAGVVEAVGDLVTSVKVGDHVVLSTLGNCGACQYCDAGRPTMCRSTFGGRSTPFMWRDQATYWVADAPVFSGRPVGKANQAVSTPTRVPFARAAL